VEPKLIEVLVTLAAHPGELVSKQDLLDAVWPNTYVVEGVLKRCVGELRRLLEDDARSPRIIETIQRRGYRLLAPVSLLAGSEALAAQLPAAPPEPTVAAEPVKSAAMKQRLMAAAAVSAVVIVGVVSYLGWPAAAPPAPVALVTRTPPADTAAPLEDTPSIAILPFNSYSERDDKQWLALGLSEEIINSLSNVPNLRVIARTSSFAMRSRSLTIPQIGTELQVGTVLEGSVRVEGKRLRVTAQLIDVATGMHIWSRNYDRALTDVFEVQDTIAREIAASVPGVMTQSGKNPYVSRARRYKDFDAYQLYLNALFLWRQRDAESHRRAAQLLEQAVALDPDFSAAYGALANVYYTSIFYAGLPYERMAALADAAAQRALRLDPHDSDALVVRCSLIKNRLEWEQAVPICREAVTSNPKNSNAQQRLGETLIQLGYLRQGRAGVERAAAIDPLAASVTSVLALAQAVNGDQEATLKAAALARELGSPRAGTIESWIHVQRKEWQLAAAGRLESANAMKQMLGHIPAVYAAAADSGNKADALALLAAASADEAALQSHFAYEYTILGRVDLALDALLRHPASEGLFGDLWLPELSPLRSAPGFDQVVERTGLAAYWRRHGAPDLCQLRRREIVCR
jgi:TolB-like protein/DNA-binding winged helix-turn-helix (wHTH) protein/Tfp pilus assembly protein PilF